ncbi:MAG: hypothetical protein ABIH17_00545 [Pseudomonadota bacterium]|jgi:hypothetical protein|uniref:hypothetical protein n=1 Tax=Hyphomonas sp. BRH_c22 TaxID=1629710 RepID=UPI000AF6DF7F|nr:hypothetical protein [Hyphomonas sp. BRH_c22]
MWLWLLWWCVDDHLAAALETPGLGELPIWVPLILSLAFAFTIDGKVKKLRKG